jgi:hypothetical protein
MRRNWDYVVDVDVDYYERMMSSMDKTRRSFLFFRQNSLPALEGPLFTRTRRPTVRKDAARRAPRQ